MKLFQLIYTSCKRGLSTGAGFQTYSMSEGITEDERREIERYGLYIPPSDLPTQPTKQEIENLFPIAMRFFRLKSGRFGICQSRYVGQDDSGRYGNYFSHALILEKGHFPVYPVQFYGSPLFKSHLSKEESEIESKPAPLPSLDLEELIAKTTIQFDDVKEFVNGKGIERVKQLVSAAISHTQTHRTLILADDRTNIPYWTAALQMAFTVKLAHRLTFTTYIHDPTVISSIIYGVPKTGSRFAFSETQRNFEYYIFDFESTEPGMEVIDSPNLFTKYVDFGFTLSPDILKEFHQFIDLFHHDAIDKQMDTITDLYQFLKLEELPPQRLLAALEFAGNASPQVLARLADSIEQIIDTVSHQINVNTAEIVITFLFKIAWQTRSPKHRHTAYNFFFKVLDHLIGKEESLGWNSAETLYKKTRELNSSNEQEFFERFLAPNRMKQMTDLITDKPGPQRAGIYWDLVVRTMASSPYNDNWKQMVKTNPQFEGFMKTVFSRLISSTSYLTGALLTSTWDRNFFLQLVSFILKQVAVEEISRGELIGSFSKIIERESAEWMARVRLDLIAMGHGDFVFREYVHRLANAFQKTKFFWDYFHEIFEKELHFKNDYFSAAVDVYLGHLFPQEKFQQCQELIHYENLIITKTTLQKVVEAVESGLKLEYLEGDDYSQVEFLAKVKQARDIFTYPNVTRLIWYGIQFEKAAANRKDLKISKFMKENPVTLKDLKRKDAVVYFRWCLPNILQLLVNPQEHQLVFHWFWVSSLDRRFVYEYTNEVFQVFKENKRYGVEILVDFLRFYLSTLFREKTYPLNLERLRGKLVKNLAKVSKSWFSHIHKRILLSTYTKEKETEKEWRDIVQEVENHQEKSIFTMIQDKLWKKKTIGKENEQKKVENEQKKRNNEKNVKE